MTKISVLLVLLVMFNLAGISFGRCTNRSKRSGNGYILQSCEASVQLTRKYRTNIDSAPKKRTEHVNFPKTAGATKHSISGGKNPAFHTRTPRVKTREMPRDLNDSPLKTIDVKPTVEHMPLIFKKKESLPQAGDAPAKKNSEPVIYFVESLQ